MNLLIISHTPHYIAADSSLVGWGPTVREIDYLAKLFTKVTHIAPLHTESAPRSSLSYQGKNIKVVSVPPAGGKTFQKKLEIIKVIPLYIKKIKHELEKADIIHIRCPANISLIALLTLAGSKTRGFVWVKYAGNWQPQGNEPWTYRWQRWWLSRGLHRGIVTINGRWPEQPPWVYSFYNPCLSISEIESAQHLTMQKKLEWPLQLLFVGRLEKEKGIEHVLKIAALLGESGINFELNVVGDGPEKEPSIRYVAASNLASRVRFHGWISRLDLPRLYTKAHLLLFPSETEGWPKVISEAMAYGVVPLASAVSSIPQIIADIGCGVAIPPTNLSTYLSKIKEYLFQPSKWLEESMAGKAAAKKFSYELYLKRLQEIFQKNWRISLCYPDDLGLIYESFNI